MAHQTGIEPSDALKDLISEALATSHSPCLRLIKICIENEELVATAQASPENSWEEDFDSLIAPIVSDQEPCYIFFRMDDRNAHQNFLWIFISYIPDSAAVRSKMLYAATKATARKAVSSGVIIDDFSSTTQSELTLKGYRRHMVSQQAAPPLTEAEQAFKDFQENEDHADIGTTTKQSHLHGVAFPVEQAALDSVVKLRDGELQYVQLSIDVKAERILLKTTEPHVDASSLKKCVPEDSPRYHLYRFKYTHEGDYKESIVFIYSQPGFRSTIRERMLYSSCKEPLTSCIENDLKLPIDKKVEVDAGDNLSEAFLLEEVHPTQAAYRPSFMKPPPPNRRRSRSPNRAAQAQQTNGSD